MSYSALPTVSTGDLWTAANHNTYIRDNFAAGVPGIFTTKGDIAAASGAQVAARVGVGADGLALIADAASAAGLKYGAPAGGFSLISSQLLAGAVATVTFSAIPATYNHLKILLDGRGSNATTSIIVQMKLNADAGSNYDFSYTLLSSSNVYSCTNTLAAAYAQVGELAAASAPASIENGMEITIMDYKGTTFQKCFQSWGSKKIGTSTGNLYQTFAMGYWRNTVAITQIDLTASAGNFIIGSMFSLYGC